LLLGLALVPAKAGFGLSPPSLRNDFLIPGSHYEQVISLARGEPDTSTKIKINIKAPEVAKWIKVEPGLEFELPAGVQQFPVKFIVDVPRSAEFKLYEGKIEIVTVPPKPESGQIATALGGVAQIALNVTDQEFSLFEFRMATLADIEENAPVKLILKIENKGNQLTGPNRVLLKVYDQNHTNVIKETEAIISEQVAPFEIKDFNIIFPVILKKGEYWGDFDIYKDSRLVKRGGQVFEVGMMGAAAPKAKPGNNLPLIFGLAALAGLIVVVALVVVLRKKKAGKMPEA